MLHVKCLFSDRIPASIPSALTEDKNPPPGVDLIFDQPCGDRSTLISTAKALQLVTVVFSWTACSNDDHRLACMDAGADAVVNSAEQLLAIVQSLGAPPTQSSLSLEPSGSQEQRFPHYLHQEDYPPIARRLARDAELAADLGPKHAKTKRSAVWTRDLSGRVNEVPPLTLNSLSKLRFVHVSDTHHHHQRVHLPPGDVLLHTGDITGNYGKGQVGVLLIEFMFSNSDIQLSRMRMWASLLNKEDTSQDLKKHLSHFLDWVCAAAPNYELVVFIAGNHDTVLDLEAYPQLAKKAHKLLQTKLPENVLYLNNSGVVFKGVHIWGSPVTKCRREELGKRYYRYVGMS